SSPPEISITAKYVRPGKIGQMKYIAIPNTAVAIKVFFLMLISYFLMIYDYGLMPRRLRSDFRCPPRTPKFRGPSPEK
ncbi:MAG: hypothetical protein PHX43_04205, partial [Alphaproteobacteria bacterium]|nr:hypothetical protein [Alphaproteobacteria bacterium]